MTKILVVAAHPDDEILGCAGTVARMVKEGAEARTLILGEGPTARGILTESDLEKVWNVAKNANDKIGIDIVYIVGFVDNRLDTLPLLEITQRIESHLERFKPNIIFTHYEHDLNIDHRITYQAVITATRPMPGQTVKEIYSFEIPSSTEWAFPLSFSPDYFVDISTTMNIKLLALQCYESELREWPHPRSIPAIDNLSEYRGCQVGLERAEAFKTVRVIR